jgi:hypothetical protein
MEIVEMDRDDAPAPIHVAAERRCLQCQASFMSRWVGERICGSCKGRHEWREGTHSMVPDG